MPPAAVAELARFPSEWGRPRGAPQSEERAQWVRDKVKAHLRAAPLRQLRARHPITSCLRSAPIGAGRESP
jgi:hypothetical protein